MPKRPTIRRPRQERSRRSLQGVLDATRELLAEKTFDELSITEILARSGQSTGRFYARFSGKEAVFQELCRRFESQVQEQVAEEVARWEGLPLATRVERLVRLVAMLNVENRPILRSMLLRVWREPGGHSRLAGEVRDEGFEELLLQGLRVGGRDGRRPAPTERAVRWAVEIVSVTCRHELLFGGLFDAEMDDPRVEEMLAVLTGLALHGLTGEAR